MNEKITEFRVTRGLEIQVDPKGNRSAMYRVYVSRNSLHPTYFRHLKNLSNIRRIRLVVQSRSDVLRSGIAHIPPTMEHAMRDYFIAKAAGKQNRYDCFSFANKCAGLPDPGEATWMRVAHQLLHRFGKRWEGEYERWEAIPERNENEMKGGDTIFLFTTTPSGKPKFDHAAVHVAEGVYASVYGVGGDLNFSTLAQMKEAWDITDIVHVEPKFGLPRA
jgi:hypothetical protein